MGPCSAERREQVLETARQLREECGSIPFIYRAGAWKPRTSPHTFQGMGSKALKWLVEAKSIYGFDVATEVATPEHVHEALEAGIDYLWIGARTSANPITVQGIVESLALSIERSRLDESRKLKGILIKNPVNNDAGLWIGNIERLEKTGIPVMAVHRGCNHQPCWAMAHAVHVAKPEIPLLIDPSHMSGDAEKIAGLIEKARELGFDGAMVEVHHKPEEALSDAKQQITPRKIREVLLEEPTSHQLISNLPTTISESTAKELSWLRAEIDELDDQLWATIAARMDVSKRIGEWKKAHGIAPLQPERYQQIREKLLTPPDPLSEGEKGLRTEFKLALWELIHEESLRQQES